jgi:transposase
MKNIVRQCIGIDCGKEEHVASYGIMYSDRAVKQISLLKIRNSKSGFEKLNKWIKKVADPSVELNFVLEATGIYHELLACYLVDHSYCISVVLPNKAKHFSKTLSIKTVNDEVSAECLSTMGLEKKLDAWKKPQPVYNHLRQLTRERDQLIQERTIVKCQLHAESYSAWPVKASMLRMKERIKIISRQIVTVEKEIKQVIDTNEELKVKINHVCTIKGVALITAATVIGETNGFHLVRNKKQLVSYAGLDVVEKTSGISVRGKSRISHHGNKYLRKCLHFPALAAIRSSKIPKELFVRLVSKHGIKMKAAVAVQRKILILIYTLWKTEKDYDPDYETKKSKNELGQSRKTALKELA